MIKTMIIEDDPMVRQINSMFLNKVDGFSLKIAAANLTEARIQGSGGLSWQRGFICLRKV